MKNLIEQLQEQGGLSGEQARTAMRIFRDFLIENGYDPDLSEDIRLKARAQYEKISDKAEELAGKIEAQADQLSDKTEEWIRKARKEAKKAADKLSDYLDDEK